MFSLPPSVVLSSFLIPTCWGPLPPSKPSTPRSSQALFLGGPNLHTRRQGVGIPAHRLKAAAHFTPHTHQGPSPPCPHRGPVLPLRGAQAARGRARREITLMCPPRWRAGPSQRSLSASAAAAPSQQEVRLLSGTPLTYILGHFMEPGDSNSREPPSSSNKTWALMSVCPRMTTNTLGQTAPIHSGLALSPGRDGGSSLQAPPHPDRPPQPQ